MGSTRTRTPLARQAPSRLSHHPSNLPQQQQQEQEVLLALPLPGAIFPARRSSRGRGRRASVLARWGPNLRV